MREWIGLITQSLLRWKSMWLIKITHWMMDFTERLLEHCAIAVNGTTKATFGAHTVDFKAPYPRVTMTDAIKQFTGFDITGKTEGRIESLLHTLSV